MKAKIEITPSLLKEMEENIRNSPLYKAKIEEAKLEMINSHQALKKMLKQIGKSKS